MRFVSVIVSLCVCLNAAAADELRVPVPARLLSADMPLGVRTRLLDDAEQVRQSGRAMMVAGIVLSVLGTAMTVAGPSLMMHDALCDTCSGETGIVGGIAMTSLGPIALVTGIPLWAAGGGRMKRGERARVALTTSGIRF